MRVVLFCCFLFTFAYGQRSFCGGKQCGTSTDCTQPSGTGGNVNGVCCGGMCYNSKNKPTISAGGVCDILDDCKTCGLGYSCANATGKLQQNGASGPYTCQFILPGFTPGCACNTSDQCLAGGLCGSSKSVCLATGLLSGSSCQFGEQCVSQFCDNGRCRGYDENVRTANCNNQPNLCTLDRLCSPWSNPQVTICHTTSGTNGPCGSPTDCGANRFQVELKQECVGGSPGKCVPLPGLGEVCGTSTTPNTCAYFDDGSNSVPRPNYVCDLTLQPPRCVKPAVGQPCQYQKTTCGGNLYCQYDSTQPGSTGDSGTCQTRFNIVKGANCSDLDYACQDQGKKIECRWNPNATAYQCQDTSFGTACNHSSPVTDDVQCPTDNTPMICGCDDTCTYPSSNGAGQCSLRQDARFDGLFIDVPSPPGPGLADFAGDKRAVADRFCCEGCGTSAETASSAAYGLIVDCGSLTMKVPKICDASYKPEQVLQNCDKYKPNVGTSLSASSLVIVFISLIGLWMTVQN